MKSFDFRIVSPAGTVASVRIESLIAPGVAGKFGVMASHAPMLARLGPGTIKTICDGKPKSYSIGPAVLEVEPGGAVTVLTDDASAEN